MLRYPKRRCLEPTVTVTVSTATVSTANGNESLLQKTLLESVCVQNIASFLPALDCLGVLRLVCAKWSQVRASKLCFTLKLSPYVGLENVHKFFVTSDIRAFETMLVNNADERRLTKHAPRQLPCLEKLTLKCTYLSTANSFWSVWPALRELYLDTSYLTSFYCEELPDLPNLEDLTVVCFATTVLGSHGCMASQFGLIVRSFVEATRNLTRLSIQSAFNCNEPVPHERDIVQIINTRHRTRFDMLELPRGWVKNNKLTATCRVLILHCFSSVQNVQECQRLRPGPCPDFSHVETDELTVQGSGFLSRPDVRLPRGLQVLRWGPPSRCFIRNIDAQFVFDTNLFVECALSLKVLDFGHEGFDREVLHFDVSGLKQLQTLEHVHTNQWTQRHLKLLFDCLGPQTVVHVNKTWLCADLIADILESRIKGIQGRIVLGIARTRRALIERERERLQSRGYTWEYFLSKFRIDWDDIQNPVAQIVFNRDCV